MNINEPTEILKLESEDKPFTENMRVQKSVNGGYGFSVSLKITNDDETIKRIKRICEKLKKEFKEDDK